MIELKILSGTSSYFELLVASFAIKIVAKTFNSYYCIYHLDGDPGCFAALRADKEIFNYLYSPELEREMVYEEEHD